MNIVWHCQSNCSDHVPEVPEVPPKDVPEVPEVPHVPDSIQSCLANVLQCQTISGWRRQVKHSYYILTKF